MRFLNRCCELAQKSLTSPNPQVGCVVVKNNKVVAEGYHHKPGQDHAEINALKKLKFNAKGCTIYVNVEPCCHYGRTGPCTDKIIESGVKKIVIAMKDPNPKVNGKGIKQLRRAGINVVVKNDATAKKLNEFYIKSITKKIPFVALKYAMTLDGKIAAKKGDSKWISNKKARKYVHNLRGMYDAILVGSNTVLKDNPRLTCRTGGKDPLRVIVDSTLKIPMSAKVFKDNNVVIATTKKHSTTKKNVLENRGIKVIVAGTVHVSLKSLMRKLHALDIISVLIEGGSHINASALKAGIVDKIYCFIAPKIIGGDKIPPVGDLNITKMTQAIQLKDLTIKIFDNNVLITGYHP